MVQDPPWSTDRDILLGTPVSRILEKLDFAGKKFPCNTEPS